MNAKPLSGKTALITGASKGLGKAMALSLAEAGANLALVSRDLEKLLETAAAVRAHGVEAEAIRADVTDEAQVAVLEKKVAARFGRIQILINNAGINIRKNVTDFTLVEWRSVLDTNLTGVFLLCRAFVPQMKGQGYGRILNLTSIMSHVALPGRAAYAASKSGLLGFTKALALELALEKITVNGISPGPFATEMNKPLMAKRGAQRRFPVEDSAGHLGPAGGHRNAGGLLVLRRGGVRHGHGFRHRWRVDGAVNEIRPLTANSTRLTFGRSQVRPLITVLGEPEI